MEISMETIAGAIGVSVPVLEFLICFFLTFPCSYLCRFVAGDKNRHAFVAITGAVLSYYSFGVESNLLFLVPILGSYALMTFYREKSGLLTVILAFSFLIRCHLYYMSGDAWKNGGSDATGNKTVSGLLSLGQEVDHMGALMILTLKVSSAAFNYQDGLLKEDDLCDAQIRYRLLKMPSLLAYSGYCLDCGSHLAGPVYEFKDYLDWIEGKGLWSPNQPRPPPSPFGAAMKSFIKALLCMAVYLYFFPRVPLSWYSDPGYYQWGFWRRVGYQILTGFTTRWKYYFIWSLAEASMILSGFGFSGWKDSQPRYDRAKNVDILKVELATSAAALPVYWNISVSTWLRHYVYERLITKGKKPGFWQLLATQVVSAVWHGLYAGYLFFYVSSAIMVSGSKVIYGWQKAVPKDAVLAKYGLIVLHTLYTFYVINTTSIGYVILSLHGTLAAYSSVYYSGTLLALFFAVFGSVVQLEKHQSTSSAPSMGKVKKAK